tara:strand:+ start:3570 stop:4427 length:858 start_codon:yes stop_codon:yes gene_type:complete
MVKRFILSIALLLAPTMVPAEPAPPAGYQTGHQNWDWSPEAHHQQAAVRIISGGASGSGTAVWCDGTRAIVITANHVVDSIDSCMVSWRDSQTNIGKVIGRDRVHDIAIIDVPVSIQKVVIPVGINAPGVGYRVEIMGFGGARRVLRRFYGRIISTENGNMEMEANLLPGDSGGGIIHNGSLVGVIYGGPYISDQFLDASGRTWPLIYPAGGSSLSHIRKLMSDVAPFALPHRTVLGSVLLVAGAVAMIAIILATVTTKLLAPLDDLELFTGVQDNARQPEGDIG